MDWFGDMNIPRLKIISIIGARPQFIKVAPLCRLLHEKKNIFRGVQIEHKIIHTGQHYDYFMNKIFFDQLSIPKPDFDLEVGSGTHAWQTGTILQKLEVPLSKEKPNLVAVYGDTNSTLAGALAASKMDYPVAHIESGLRSYNRMMPEETNRILTDHCSDILCCPTENAYHILEREGFENSLCSGKIFPLGKQESCDKPDRFPLVVNIGDMMYDSLLMSLDIAKKTSQILQELKLNRGDYFLATLHRAENTDSRIRLEAILAAFNSLGKEKTFIFPIHPRTRKMMDAFGIDNAQLKNIRFIDPVSYFDMLFLLGNSYKLLTDSGGMQKEAFLLKVPCVTLRDETEWIETLANGANVIMGSDQRKIISEAQKPFDGHFPSDDSAPFGDGRSAERFLDAVIFLKDLL